MHLFARVCSSEHKRQLQQQEISGNKSKQKLSFKRDGTLLLISIHTKSPMHFARAITINTQYIISNDVIPVRWHSIFVAVHSENTIYIKRDNTMQHTHLTTSLLETVNSLNFFSVSLFFLLHSSAEFSKFQPICQTINPFRAKILQQKHLKVLNRKETIL